MKVKSQLYRVLLAAAIITLCSTSVGCKHEQPENPDNKPTSAVLTPTDVSAPENKPTPVESTDDIPSATPDATAEPDPATAGPTEAAEPDDDDDDDEPDIVPSVGDDDDDDDDEPDDPTTPAPKEPEPEDILRTESWNGSFLIWIPEFTEGTYVGTQAEETEDIALFTTVDETAVREYIALLGEKDFVHQVETADDGNGIIYEACNTDNWWVSVSYHEGELSIGSGYRVEQTEPADRLAKLWETTLFRLLPKFEEGTMAGMSSDSDSEPFVLFEGVTDEYVRAYTEALIEAGFTEDADEGDSDGFIWYSAEDGEGNLCDLTYYDGSVRLSITK